MMLEKYRNISLWFQKEYGHLGLSLSKLTIDDDGIYRFDILYKGCVSKLTGFNFNKVLDFIVTDDEFKKLIFDALLRSEDYFNMDFKPKQKINKFTL